MMQHSTTLLAIVAVLAAPLMVTAAPTNLDLVTRQAVKVTGPAEIQLGPDTGIIPKNADGYTLPTVWGPTTYDLAAFNGDVTRQDVVLVSKQAGGDKEIACTVAPDGDTAVTLDTPAIFYFNNYKPIDGSAEMKYPLPYYNVGGITFDCPMLKEVMATAPAPPA